MPGPLNKNHTRHQPFYGEPSKGLNRKIAKRLEARINNVPVSSNGYLFHKPGSQNRSK